MNFDKAYEIAKKETNEKKAYYAVEKVTSYIFNMYPTGLGGAPVVIVNKKTGKYRKCNPIGAPEINEKTVKIYIEQH